MGPHDNDHAGAGVGRSERFPSSWLPWSTSRLTRSGWTPAAISEYVVRRSRHIHDAHIASERTVTVVQVTDRLASIMPGVFAVGDLRRRSVRRVASAVGEGAVAIQSVHQYLGDDDVRTHA